MLSKLDLTFNLKPLEAESFSIYETLPKRKCGIKLSKDYFITQEENKYYVRKRYFNVNFEFDCSGDNKHCFNSPYIEASFEINQGDYKRLKNSNFLNKKEILTKLDALFTTVDSTYLYYYNADKDRINQIECSYITLSAYINSLTKDDLLSKDSSLLDKYPKFSEDKNTIINHCISLNQKIIKKNNELVSSYFSEISLCVSQYEALIENSKELCLSDKEIQLKKEESENKVNQLKKEIDLCMQQTSKIKKCIKNLKAELN